MNRRQFFSLGVRMAGAMGVAVTANHGESKAWAGDAPAEDSPAIDTAVVLEEVQAEAYLAMLDGRYADALDWSKTNLVATDTPQSLNSRLDGKPAVERGDPDAVWLEGNAHVVAALRARRRKAARDLPTFYGDLATASEYQSHIILAQSELGQGQTINGVAIPDGPGVVAASSTPEPGSPTSRMLPRRHVVVLDRHIGGQPVPVVSLRQSWKRGDRASKSPAPVGQ
jgi:hypothetical protein